MIMYLNLVNFNFNGSSNLEIGHEKNSIKNTNQIYLWSQDQ